MLTRLLVLLALCLAPALAWAHGSTYPSSDTAVVAIIDANGNVVNPGDLANRAIRTTIVSGGAGGGVAVMGCTANAAAPTFVEGSTENPLSCTLLSGVRVSFVDQLSGEIQGVSQATSMLAISGGVVRGTVGNLATGLTTNTTSVYTTLPTGAKSIYGSVTGTGAVTQTQKIYGGIASGFTPATEGILLCTLTLSGTTTAVDQCPVISSNNLFYKVVTSGTTGTGATGVLTAQY